MQVVSNRSLLCRLPLPGQWLTTGQCTQSTHTPTPSIRYYRIGTESSVNSVYVVVVIVVDGGGGGGAKVSERIQSIQEYQWLVATCSG